MTATWRCEQCGKQTDGRSGIDDAMDCFCDRCDDCHELTWDCVCQCFDPYCDHAGDTEWEEGA